MKQVININFQGRVVPIEVTAFELLKNYTESLNRHFASEEGKDEIINDIESRIGELFQERLTKGATCITDEDVQAIIKSMGRPEDFEEAAENIGTNQNNYESFNAEDEARVKNTAHPYKRLYRDENNKILGGVCSGIANYFGIDPLIVRILFVVTGIGFFLYFLLWIFVPSSSEVTIGGTRKKLYRDGEDKIVAGVCSGIANYFGINPWIPRILFLVPFLSFAFRWGHWGSMDFPDFLQIGFSPGSLIIYIILWMVIPEAVTTTEKLEMKGEKVDMNSIKNSVMEEMKGIQQKAKKLGNEATTLTKEKGAMMSKEISRAAKRSGWILGDIITTVVKIIGYLIVGAVCIGLIIGLFAIGIVSLRLFPLKDFILVGEWQNVYAWGTLLLFIGVPIIGMVTFLIRRLARIKTGSRMIRLSSICLWIVGWVCFILLLSSLGREFRKENTLTPQEITLVNSKQDKLEITSTSPVKKYQRYNWFRLGPFDNMDEDTAFVKNVRVRIVKSPNDSFRVVMLKIAYGRTIQHANMLASKIDFNVLHKDSLLILDKGIPINRNDKFRNQHVVLTVYVPVGKQIKVSRSVGWGNNICVDFPWSDEMNIDFDEKAEYGWELDTDYIMRADGLYDLQGMPADEWKHENSRDYENNERINSRSNYRYNEGNVPTTTDSLREKQNREIEKINDSLERAIQKAEEEKQKLQRMKEKIQQEGNSGAYNTGSDFSPMYKFSVNDPTMTFH